MIVHNSTESFRGFAVHLIPAEIRALEFAQKAHEGQKRPGGEPQINHVARVFNRAMKIAESMTPYKAYVLLASAALHDVLEDTDTTEQEIEEQFGSEVARTVRALSHESEEEPDDVYLRRVAAGGRLSVLVKRCDRLDNLESLTKTSRGFRERKLAEIRAALPIWKEIDPGGVVEIAVLLQEIEHESVA